MDVRAKARGSSIRVVWEAVCCESMPTKCGVDFCIFAREDLPTHFYPPFQSVSSLWRGGRLTQGDAECPATKDVPMLDPGLSPYL